MQDVSPARHLASGLLLFSCPSSVFSTQENGLLMSLQSRHLVFVSTTRPLTCSYVNTHRAVFSSGQSNYTGLRISVPSHLNIPVWCALLRDYENSVICEFLEFVWPLGYTKQTLPVFNLRTHRGTLKFPSVVQDYISSEISLGRIAGPFNAPPFPDSFVVSPPNMVAKRDSQERRVIVDLSWACGSSVNHPGWHSFWFLSRRAPRIELSHY